MLLKIKSLAITGAVSLSAELSKWVRADIYSLIKPGSLFVSGVLLGQLVSSPNQEINGCSFFFFPFCWLTMLAVESSRREGHPGGMVPPKLRLGSKFSA